MSLRSCKKILRDFQISHICYVFKYVFVCSYTSLQDIFDCAPIVLLPFIYNFQITLFKNEPMNNTYNDFVKKLPKLSLVAKKTFGKNIRIKRAYSQVEKNMKKIVKKGNK